MWGLAAQAVAKRNRHPPRVASVGGGRCGEATHPSARRRSTEQAVPGLTRHSTRPGRSGALLAPLVESGAGGLVLALDAAVE